MVCAGGHVECLRNDLLSHCCVTLLFPVFVMRRPRASDVGNEFLITCSLLAQLAGKLTARASASCLMCVCACVSVCLCVCVCAHSTETQTYKVSVPI